MASPSARSAACLLALVVAGCRPAAPRLSPNQPAALAGLVPQPNLLRRGNGRPFTVTDATVISVPSGDERAAFVGRYLADLIATGTLPAPRVVSGDTPPGGISLAVDAALAPDHYELTVTDTGVRLRGGDAAGLFHGAQTLRQLLPADVEYEAARLTTLMVPSVHIEDGPRFGWRGAMLDVSRHFFGVADVKRYVDLMALHKLNRLHLHLSDDQGWRLEIRSWPNLTAHGGGSEVGGGPGGFYTQAQYREIVAYAADRFITVVPEIDMPGHSNAALASYAELNCNGKAPPRFTGIEVGFSALCVENETTFRFVDDVVREIAALTPGPFVHIGGDEVKTLSASQYRQFVERVQTIVRSHGKRMIGWDEIAPIALDATSVVQHWRPKATSREAVAKGAKVILSPADRVYLDMKYTAATPIGLRWAAIIDVRATYDWEPATHMDGVGESDLLGIEAPLWTETAAEMRDVEYLAFPRLAAVAEVAWTRRDRRSWPDFAVRLGAQSRRWSALGINFYRSPQIPWQP
jgi:hexosaminidase